MGFSRPDGHEDGVGDGARRREGREDLAADGTGQVRGAGAA